MRDILVTAIVLGTLPFVFRHAWIGVLLWTWLSVMNPHRLAWGFAYNAPFAAMTAGVTLLALFTTKDRVELPKKAVVYVLLAFNLWMCITTALGIHPAEGFEYLKRVLKIQLMTFVALAVLRERRHIELFLWINILSLGFYGAKGGLYTLTGGEGLVWGPGGFVGGNNELGLALVIAIPLMNYARLTTERVWLRWGMLGVMFLSAAAIFGTKSRGDFLAIAAMALFLWWRAPKKLLFGAFIALSAAVLLGAMADTWFERMRSIQNYQADGSAMGRLNAWATMLNIANSRIFGAGFEIYTPKVFQMYAPDPSVPRAAHSIYFQVLGEHGWVGLVMFLAVWILVWRCAQRLRRDTKGEPEYAWVYFLAGMCQVALVGFAVGGAFLSLAYYDLPYNILVILLVTERWLALQRAAQPAAGTIAGARTPLGAPAPASVRS
jgi:putative inorganic carbon (HCO3(-)) transporter